MMTAELSVHGIAYSDGECTPHRAPIERFATTVVDWDEEIGILIAEIDKRLGDRPNISPDANAAAAWPSTKAQCGVHSPSEQTVNLEGR